ncbi:MAG: DMT family transporter [Chloroflexi bacterium]|nr:MAG: DMT family transporter [Chloroflexota bacterium]
MNRETAVSNQNTSPPWPWIAAALAAHTSWGAYPVLARYLQTISQLPSMSLLAFGNTLVLILIGFWYSPRLDRHIFRSRILWAFSLIVVARSITNLLAARFTLSIYVQLITQMTPFLVVLLTAVFLHEPLPRYTGRAITLGAIGALLMMSAQVGEAGITLSLTPSDWLGLGLAFISSLSLALYMIVVRRTVRHNVPGEAVFIVQLVTLVTVSTLVSLLLGEDWSRYRAINLTDWLVFGVFTFGVFLGANLGQINALRHLGAPMVGSLLAWRLVSALVVAAFLLHERLTTAWQLFGAGLVLVTITWYLWQQQTR